MVVHTTLYQLNSLQIRNWGHTIIGDKGFPKFLTETGAVIVMPPFKSKNSQFTKQELQYGYEIASVRVHVERVIGRMKGMVYIWSH